VSDFIEVLVTLLPSDAGGRTSPIAPRNGTYRPVLRSPHGARARVRFLEGPPQITPGDAALVVAEIENDADEILTAGAELDLMEPDGRQAGLATAIRRWREAVA
ncbi:MAG: hypothetical protein ACXV7D_12985, partial [Thermoanaerobaculia bacterium]